MAVNPEGQHPRETSHKPSISAGEIFLSPRKAVIQRTALALDSGEVFPPNIIQALLIRDAKDAADTNHKSWLAYMKHQIPGLHSPSRLDVLRAQITSRLKHFRIVTKLPISEMRRLSEVPDLADSVRTFRVVAPEKLKTFPEGILETQLHEVTKEAFKRLDKNEKILTAKWMFDAYMKGDDSADIVNFVHHCIQPSQEPDVKKLWVNLVGNELTQAKQNNDLMRREKASYALGTLGAGEIAAVEGLRKEDMKMLLGADVEKMSLPTALNEIREKMKVALRDDNKPLVQRYIFAGNLLMGFNPPETHIPFHPNLNSLYRSLKDFFVSYKPNVEAQQREEQLLGNVVETKVLPALKGRKGVALDLGCGTGRIVNAVATKFPDNFEKIIGVDVSPENLEMAKRASAAAGVDDRVEYQSGNWLDKLDPKVLEILPRDIIDIYGSPLVDRDSIDFLTAMGRSFPHVENATSFLRQLATVAQVIKPGGHLLFDMPDANKGIYLENRKKVLDIYRSLGVTPRSTDPGEQLQKVDYVIDSPDGKNFYNRFVPQEQWILDQLEPWFEVEVLDKAPIADGHGSETVYFIARKREVMSEDALDRLEMFDLRPINEINFTEEEDGSRKIEIYFPLESSVKKRQTTVSDPDSPSKPDQT